MIFVILYIVAWLLTAIILATKDELGEPFDKGLMATIGGSIWPIMLIALFVGYIGEKINGKN